MNNHNENDSRSVTPQFQTPSNEERPESLNISNNEDFRTPTPYAEEHFKKKFQNLIENENRNTTEQPTETTSPVIVMNYNFGFSSEPVSPLNPPNNDDDFFASKELLLRRAQSAGSGKRHVKIGKDKTKLLLKQQRMRKLSSSLEKQTRPKSPFQKRFHKKEMKASYKQTNAGDTNEEGHQAEILYIEKSDDDVVKIESPSSKSKEGVEEGNKILPLLEGTAPPKKIIVIEPDDEVKKKLREKVNKKLQKMKESIAKVDEESEEEEEEKQSSEILDMTSQIIKMIERASDTSKSDQNALHRIANQVIVLKNKLGRELQRYDMKYKLVQGQLLRRNREIREHRALFYKELTLLREQLFRVMQDPNYIPEDYQLYEWKKNEEYKKLPTERVKKVTPIQSDIVIIEDEETKEDLERKEMEMRKRNLKRKEQQERERMIYKTLRDEAREISEILTKLRKLEYKRKVEIEELKKQRIEAEKLRNEIIQAKDAQEKALNDAIEQAKKEAEKAKLEADKAKFVQLQLKSQQKSQQISEQKSQEKVEPLLPPIVEPSPPPPPLPPLPPLPPPPPIIELQNVDKAFDEKLKQFGINLDSDEDIESEEEEKGRKKIPQLLKASHSTKNLLKMENESLGLLETQIQDFHGRFKDLFQQMKIVKTRLNFYENSKKDAVDKGKAPTGEVTLVFTDVQDSTRLWELDIEAMSTAIKIHNEVVRSFLKKFNGYEVKTEGDAFMCAFSNVLDAIEFALHTQLELLNQQWPEEIYKLESCKIVKDRDGTVLYNGLRVRMGIHVGEPLCEVDPITQRTDYFGPVVNRAARVEGQAKGGQILISSSIWSEIENRMHEISIPVHVEFIGSVLLKGMDEPETLRCILPWDLRHRKFSDKPQESSNDGSMKALQQKLLSLQQQHKQLEGERDAIQAKINHDLKLKALEESMLEKDNIIHYLRKKIQRQRKLLERSFFTKTDTERKRLQQKNIQLQEDISSVMKKYDEMKIQYNSVKSNFDEVVGLFNKRLAAEMEYFRKEISNMHAKLERRKRRRENIRDKLLKEIDFYKKKLSEQQQKNRENENEISTLKSELVLKDLQDRHRSNMNSHRMMTTGTESNALSRVQSRATTPSRATTSRATTPSRVTTSRATTPSKTNTPSRATTPSRTTTPSRSRRGSVLAPINNTNSNMNVISTNQTIPTISIQEETQQDSNEQQTFLTQEHDPPLILSKQPSFFDASGMLQKTIKDAIHVDQSYKNFDWKSFVKEERMKRGEQITQLDEQKKEEMDQEREWAAENYHKTIDKLLQQTNQRPQNKIVSYSRMLMNSKFKVPVEERKFMENNGVEEIQKKDVSRRSVMLDYLETLTREKLKKKRRTEKMMKLTLPSLTQNQRIKQLMNIAQERKNQELELEKLKNAITEEDQRKAIYSLLYYEKNAKAYKMEKSDNDGGMLYVRGRGGELTEEIMNDIWAETLHTRRLIGLKKVDQAVGIQQKINQKEFELKLKQRNAIKKLRELEPKTFQRSQSTMGTNSSESSNHFIPLRAHSSLL